jgi:predicted Zn-dependent protease
MRNRATWALALAIPLALAGCTVNPVTGQSQLDLLGEGQEVEMGASLYPQAIQGSLGPIGDPTVQAEVTRVGERLAAVSHRPALPYRFTAVNDPEVNAFALPGGKICITRGLLSRLDSEDAMAAVLGHEIGHVTARHAVAAYNRQLLAGVVSLGAGVYVATSDSEYRGLVGLGAVLGSQLVLARYSRDQERQSDDLGIDYAVKAGYSPRGMIETQEVLLELRKQQPSAVERLLASHPMSAERLATAEREVSALPAEVRDRPVENARYQRVFADVIRERPAWDRAADAQSRFAERKYREAEAGFAEAVRLAPTSGVLRTFHALSLAQIERSEAALAEAREGARLDGQVFVSRLVAGDLMIRPEPEGALEQLDRAEKLLPGQATVAYGGGRAYEQLGRRTEATEAYREAVRRDPDGKVGAAAGARLEALGMASF